MSKILKIGIVGCGAIGSSLAKIISKDLADKAKVTALYDIDHLKSAKLSGDLCQRNKLAVKSMAQLIQRSNLVIEAACASVSAFVTEKALGKGRDIMVMSVGGILDNYTQLLALAEKKHAKLHIPSGAICGIDGLKALGLSRIHSVTLTTTKHPRSFKGVKYIQDNNINLEAIKQDTVIFEGSAQEATKHFPQNINVAAVLSLAGIGPQRTKVRIVASAAVERNIHQIEIDSDAGKIIARTENVLHPDNPKTSFLAVLSAVAVLKQIVGSARIGA